LRYQLNANQVRIWIKAHEQLAIPSTQLDRLPQFPNSFPFRCLRRPQSLRHLIS
jgi:hypothetical protein